MRRRPHRLLVAVAVVAAVAVACSADGEVVDFGAPPPEGGPTLPADGGLSVHDADSPTEVPPRDADLFDGGWPEAAAWIARETGEDRPVLVNIFASWCVPCERELPLLMDAAADNPDVTFLGIGHIDARPAAERFVEEQGITFPTIYDIDGDVAFAVGSRGMPTTVVFDREGELVGRVVGELTDRTLEELLDSVR